MNIDDAALEKYIRAPRSSKIAAYLVAGTIVAAGATISWLIGDWGWLARSGALIVVLAMLMEGFGVQKFINNIVPVAKDITEEVVRMQLRRLPHLYGVTGKETTEEFEAIAQKEHRRRLKEVRAYAEKVMLRDFRRVEFSIASVGTILWGFADLLNRL